MSLGLGLGQVPGWQLGNQRQEVGVTAQPVPVASVPTAHGQAPGTGGGRQQRTWARRLSQGGQGWVFTILSRPQGPIENLQGGEPCVGRVGVELLGCQG